MAEQNFKNHTRFHPMYHYVVVPILLLNFLFAVIGLFKSPDLSHAWNIVVAFALAGVAVLVRTYALKVQDRVIRLEERIRMAALLPMEAREMQRELTNGQIVALRFASDAELAPLAERAVRERLAPKAIKAQVQAWRPDTHRV